MNNTKAKILNVLKIVALAGALSIVISYAAWVGPTDAPPAGNIEAPINVGSVDQTKAGDVCTSKGGTTRCLSTAGGTNKFCFGEHGTDNWYISLQVPSDWTITQCRDALNVMAPAYETYKVGCINDSTNTVSVSSAWVGKTLTASVPSSNCGW